MLIIFMACATCINLIVLNVQILLNYYCTLYLVFDCTCILKLVLCMRECVNSVGIESTRVLNWSNGNESVWLEIRC